MGVRWMSERDLLIHSPQDMELYVRHYLQRASACLSARSHEQVQDWMEMSKAPGSKHTAACLSLL